MSLFTLFLSMARGNFLFDTENMTLIPVPEVGSFSSQMTLKGYFVKLLPSLKRTSISFNEDNRSCFDSVKPSMAAQMKLKYPEAGAGRRKKELKRRIKMHDGA